MSNKIFPGGSTPAKVARHYAKKVQFSLRKDNTLGDVPSPYKSNPKKYAGKISDNNSAFLYALDRLEESYKKAHEGEGELRPTLSSLQQLVQKHEKYYKLGVGIGWTGLALMASGIVLIGAGISTVIPGSIGAGIGMLITGGFVSESAYLLKELNREGAEVSQWIKDWGKAIAEAGGQPDNTVEATDDSASDSNPPPSHYANHREPALKEQQLNKAHEGVSGWLLNH